ncbi:Tryptophan synthase beta chain OS=Streptomyces antimycoticus OX=68175 GN=trpB PE=3 SV=1 [Streptomyces antimycoticus]
MSSDFFIPDPEGRVPSAEGYFGAFGGKFIPEALVAAVDEVAAEYEKAKTDPAFAAELEDLLVNYTGRPSAADRGAAVRRARAGARGSSSSGLRTSTTPAVPQDQQCAGAGPAHQAHGQVPGHRRGAPAARSARRGHGHRLCAVRARMQPSTWARSTPSGRRSMSAPDADAGRRGHLRDLRQPHPEGRHQRGVPGLGRPRWSPHPLTSSVRWPGGTASVRRWRAACAEDRRGGAAAVPGADRAARRHAAAGPGRCGGANAIGLFHAFCRTRVPGAWSASRLPDTVWRTGAHAACVSQGEPGSCHRLASGRSVLPGEDGRVGDPEAVSSSGRSRAHGPRRRAGARVSL